MSSQLETVKLGSLPTVQSLALPETTKELQLYNMNRLTTIQKLPTILKTISLKPVPALTGMTSSDGQELMPLENGGARAMNLEKYTLGHARPEPWERWHLESNLTVQLTCCAPYGCSQLSVQRWIRTGPL